jgi:hypothetical protein
MPTSSGCCRRPVVGSRPGDGGRVRSIKRTPVWVPPAGWPAPRPGWVPSLGWRPDRSWPAVPAGHQWWQPTARGRRRRRIAIALVGLWSSVGFPLRHVSDRCRDPARTCSPRGAQLVPAALVGDPYVLVVRVGVRDGRAYPGWFTRGGGVVGAGRVGASAWVGLRGRAVRRRGRSILGRPRSGTLKGPHADCTRGLAARWAIMAHRAVFAGDRRVRRVGDAAEIAGRFCRCTNARRNRLSAEQWARPMHRQQSAECDLGLVAVQACTLAGDVELAHHDESDRRVRCGAALSVARRDRDGAMRTP